MDTSSDDKIKYLRHYSRTQKIYETSNPPKSGNFNLYPFKELSTNNYSYHTTALTKKRHLPQIEEIMEVL